MILESKIRQFSSIKLRSKGIDNMAFLYPFWEGVCPVYRVCLWYWHWGREGCSSVSSFARHYRWKEILMKPLNKNLQPVGPKPDFSYLQMWFCIAMWGTIKIHCTFPNSCQLIFCLLKPRLGVWKKMPQADSPSLPFLHVTARSEALLDECVSVEDTQRDWGCLYAGNGIIRG